MHARIRIAAAVAAAVGALTLTACDTGSTVVDKPKDNAAAPADSGKDAAKEKSKEKSEAPEVAKVGDTLTLEGFEEGSKLDVTVVKVADPAKSADEFMEPASGKRFVGVQFQLVNTGEAAYSDSPSNGAQVADSEGQQFDATFGDITAGPSMASSLKLKPGAKGLGWIVFEVPEAAKVDTVQFTMDSGFADKTGEWKLR
ncbi:DUF4352 domain-containing protein [Streptomyces sp. M2CJ-2]|uniref:DUF4352 domain-containing protein n=1 Tax=Streptomyces sp. M2CJ-2 TaxID=2803948 RepID=UPI001927DE7C|nr:DUF4352 domain-containing protein [Streptomyces sp. M2CJ-2]MBL3669678.1 DUF4352 domain-containing protein [Streptomyces sp. M2CJ-2]